MKSLIPAVVAVALAAGAAAASARQQDVIKKADNTEVKGRVTRASFQTVMFTDAQGKAVTLKGTEVSDIIFGDEPPSLPRAKLAWSEGPQKFDKAAQLFDDALKEIEGKKHRDLNKAPVLFNWGLFLAERGDVDASLAMLKRVRAECGDSWWRPESYRRAIDIAKPKGVETQVAILNEMKAEPEPLGSEAEMGLAEIAVGRNDFEEALAIYTKVSGIPSSPHAEAGKLGVFRSLKKLNKKSDLDSFAQRLSTDRDASPALLQAAAAWAATSALEKAGKDKTRLRDVIVSAGKAIAMGPPERKEDGEDYVAALRVAAKAYGALAGDAAKPEHKQEYKERAARYLTEIVNFYRGTPWAETAQLELDALGLQTKE